MAAPSFRDYQLPRGRHGLSPSLVAENQRWRLIGAASEVLAEERVIGLRSRSIARRAGVSSHTFYEHFEDVDDVLLAAFVNAAQLLVQVIAANCSGSDEPQEKKQKALAAALSLAANELGLTALIRVEVAVAIPKIAAERVRLIGRLAALVRGPEGSVQRDAAVAGALVVGVEWLEHRTASGEVALSLELASLLD